MYPILYENSWLLIPAWHTFYVLGAFLGYWVFLTGLSFAPLENRRQASKLFLLIYFSGYFGARIFALLVEEDYRPWQTDFWFELSKLGAMTLYGGVISGLIATLLYCKKKRLSIAAYFDPLVIAALVAIAIGRIGCFLNGDDYGIAIPNQSDPAPWWAVAFPNHIEHVYRYPTQLMETAICLMFALLGYKWLGKLKAGLLGCILASLYMIQRFFLEFLRGDERGELFVSGLSPAQLISIVGLIIFSSYFFLLLRLKPDRH